MDDSNLAVSFDTQGGLSAWQMYIHMYVGLTVDFL